MFSAVLYLINGKAVPAIVEKGPFPFLLVIQPVHNALVKFRAFLPFLAGNGKHHALRLLHEIVQVKDHSGIFASLHHVDGQILLQQLRRTFPGQGQQIAARITVVLFQFVSGKGWVWQGVFVQTAFLFILRLDDHRLLRCVRLGEAERLPGEQQLPDLLKLCQHANTQGIKLGIVLHRQTALGQQLRLGSGIAAPGDKIEHHRIIGEVQQGLVRIEVMAAIVIVVAPTHIYLIIWPYKSIQLRAVFGFVMTDSGCARLEKIIRFQFAGLQLFQNTGAFISRAEKQHPIRL